MPPWTRRDVEDILFLGVLTWRTTHELDPYQPIASNVKPIEVDVVARKLQLGVKLERLLEFTPAMRKLLLGGARPSELLEHVALRRMADSRAVV